MTDSYKSIKTYIVDDEAFILEWLIHHVEWGIYNCEVVGSALSAEEALDYLGDNHVDLLITDVSMNGMSGLELIQRAKKLNPNLSVVIISAYSKFEYVKEAIKYGIVNYLLKPININELYECLKITQMNHAKLLNQDMNQDKVVFRNSILHELLSGGMDEFKLREQCELAGIHLEESVYRVIVLAVEELEKSTCLSLINRFNKRFEGKGYCFFGSRKNLVILCQGECGSVSDLQHKVESVFRKEGVGELFYVIGAALLGYDKIPESYRSCCNFIDAKFVFSSRHVCMEDYPYEKYMIPLKSNLLHQLESMVYMRDAKKLIQLVKKMNDEWQQESAKKRELICAAVFLIRCIRLKYPTQKKTMPEGCLEQMKTSEDMLGWIYNYYSCIINDPDIEGEKGISYVDRAIMEVNLNYSDRDLSIAKVADLCGITSAYMGQLFYTQTGEYFNEFLLRKRLEMVVSDLIDSGRNVGSIASAAGFASQSYFNKMFHKYYGMSPVEYRKNVILKKED